MELAPGTVLLGKYRVDEVLGVGGMGRVVRASHQYLQQSVAIKILLPQMTESPSTVARFLREAQATVRLKNEHIARVIDVGTMPDGTPFMVMEYLEGNDLNQILRHHGPQTPNIVVDLMLQACEGMSEAHAFGIVHRDIKPSNYFITRRPDGSMLLKILDFGISKTPVNFEELTGTQTVIGTPSYMAPEQMKSGKQADARSDIWSMGVVMYQLLQGRPPFSGESYAELVLKVGAEPPNPLHVPLPAGLGEVIFRCLEKDPKQRPQDVGELARSLAPFATDPISAAQIAARTTRILSHRNSSQAFGGPGFGGQGLPLAAGGGLSAPVPLSPAQLTPRSWPPSSTSLSQGRGQVTLRTKSSKGWMIAGGLSLAILAGAGGYIASSLRRSSNANVDESSSAEGPTVHMPATAPIPAATMPGVTTPAVTTVTTPTVPAPTVATPNVATPNVPAPTVPAPTVPAPTITVPTVATPSKVAAPTVANSTVPTSKVAAPGVANPTVPTSKVAAPAVAAPAKTTTPTTKTSPTTKAVTTTTKATATTATKSATPTTKAVAKTAPKATTKTEPKTPTKTPSRTGDLFDSRH